MDSETAKRGIADGNADEHKQTNKGQKQTDEVHKKTDTGSGDTAVAPKDESEESKLATSVPSTTQTETQVAEPSKKNEDDIPLPAGWVVHYSKSQKRNYYHHSKTGKAVWKRSEIPTLKRTGTPERDNQTKKTRLTTSSSSEKQSKNDSTKSGNGHGSSRGSDSKKQSSSHHQRSRGYSRSGQRELKVAIIVPFRDLHPQQERSKHLERFVPSMTEFLASLHPKVDDYHIFIVEQSNDGRKFNRGKLLNIGFKLARDNYDSFIFHDVDLLPKDSLGDWYGKYPSYPIHIARCWNRYNDNKKYFGGIVAFSRKDFEQIDGFPNTYWGWGGEDDELFQRVSDARLKIIAPPKNLDAVIDMEEMDLSTKLNVLRNSNWKCMVKWEVADEYKNYRQEQRYSRDRNYQFPVWWGLQGVRFKELSRTSMSGKCTRITVDVQGNLNDDGTEHWANKK